MDTFTIWFFIIHWLITTEIIWLLVFDDSDIFYKIGAIGTGFISTLIISLIGIIINNPTNTTIKISKLTPLIELAFIIFIIVNLWLKDYLKQKNII